jgi:uncharacterized protein (DUF1499 family)
MGKFTYIVICYLLFVICYLALVRYKISLQSADRPLISKLKWFFPEHMQTLFRLFPLFRLFSLKIVPIGLAFVVTIAGLFGSNFPALANDNLPETMVASLLSFSGDRPTNLGVKNGALTTCPASPNCVSSQSGDAEHQIAPLTYKATPAEAIGQLKEIIEKSDNAKIITAEHNYIYAEFTSKLMGFVDDVEFYLDPESATIQVRSASRIGESDLGVNRKRIEAIRSQFNP